MWPPSPTTIMLDFDLNLLTHLDPDRARTDGLLERVGALAAALSTS